MSLGKRDSLTRLPAFENRFPRSFLRKPDVQPRKAVDCEGSVPNQGAAGETVFEPSSSRLLGFGVEVSFGYLLTVAGVTKGMFEL